MLLFKCFFVIALVSAALSTPLPKGYKAINSRDERKLMQAGFYEGDMILKGGRNALVNTRYRWTNKIVYYDLAADFTTDETNTILGALNEIQSTTCLQFVKRTNQNNYIKVTGEMAGCYSYVGMVGGAQILNLQRYDPVVKAHCVHHGTVAHEFLHALGLYHQQSATNRDNYVTIDLSNVSSGMEYNFDKYASSLITDFGIAYDYESIMHYDSYAFSKNGLRTIITKDPAYQDVIGQNVGLSQGDIAKLRTMYSC